jgi:hypothetical protein
MSAPQVQFEEILDQLYSVREDVLGPGAAKNAASAATQSMLERLLELQAEDPGISAEWLAQFYDADWGDSLPSSGYEVPDPPAVLQSLGILRDLSIEDLFMLRRAFARAHHPDLASPALKREATRRMALANMMIDRALAEKRAPQS